VDANYPAHALHSRVITLAGVDMATTMAAIASLFPIDAAVTPAVFGMVPDAECTRTIDSHAVVSGILTEAEDRHIEVAPLERTPFYTQAKQAFAAVLTGETSGYACFLVTKGVMVSAGANSAS